MSFHRESSKTKVAAIAQADRTYNRIVEVKPQGKTGIDRRLWAALPATHEVPERECLTSPLEDIDPCRWKSSDLQLRLHLPVE